MSKIVHIAYGDSAAGCLRAAIKLGMPGDEVVVSRDDFTQGPISDCLVDGGLAQRSQYWSSLKTLHSNIENVYEHYSSSIKGINNIDAKSKVFLWIGDSAHDILASAWVLTYLKHTKIDWYYIDLKEVVSTDDLKLVNAAMLTPQEILESYNVSVPISNEYGDELNAFWNRISINNAPYRIQNNGSVVSVTEDYHDPFILSHLTKKEQVLGKLLGSIMGDSVHRLTDTTIESRLVILQSQNKIKIEMNLARIFLSKVRLK